MSIGLIIIVCLIVLIVLFVVFLTRDKNINKHSQTIETKGDTVEQEYEDSSTPEYGDYSSKQEYEDSCGKGKAYWN